MIENRSKRCHLILLYLFIFLFPGRRPHAPTIQIHLSGVLKDAANVSVAVR